VSEQETRQECFLPQDQEADKTFVAQIRESVANSACGFPAAALDRAAHNQEAGDFPSIETLFRCRGKPGSLGRSD
jgi:hypothetical protein